MTNTFKVYGSAKVQEITLNKFDYSQTTEAALSTFAALVATRKEEVYKAFNSLCHVALAHACAHKTAKERHTKIQETRDAFFEQLPKKFASAFAKGVSALEWGIPEDFEEFDFSDFLESEKKECPPRERGADAIYKALQKKLDACKKQFDKLDNARQEIPPYLDEEIATYALLLKTRQ